MDAPYILVTPCFNEEKYIGFPLDSMTSQDSKPIRWVVVDDGSTDRTADLIKEKAVSEPWIRYHYRIQDDNKEYFASNVHAIEEGIQVISDELKGGKHEDCRYIAILDSDISLPPDYYSQIISRMEKNPEIGIASGIYENLIEGKLVPVLNDRRSTPKAIMVFRRDCYEEIGGLLPLSLGGEDTAACVTARMKGWVTWSFPDVKVVHHRPTGMGNSKNIRKARFNMGLSEYGLGSHPLFVLMKSAKRALKEKPLIIGGILRFAGFLSGYIRVRSRIVSEDFIRYYRKEQMSRLMNLNRVPEGSRIIDTAEDRNNG